MIVITKVPVRKCKPVQKNKSKNVSPYKNTSPKVAHGDCGMSSSGSCRIRAASCTASAWGPPAESTVRKKSKKFSNESSVSKTSSKEFSVRKKA